jgi:transposase
VRRYDLSVAQWSLLAPEFPPPASTGRPRRDRRQIWNGILWILHTGAPWRDLPLTYGPWQTVYHYFNLWRKDGTFDRAVERLRERLDRQGLIDWDLWMVDGSSIRAGRAAGGAGKRGGPGSPRITRWVVPEAGTARRSTSSATAGARRSRSS